MKPNEYDEIPKDDGTSLRQRQANRMSRLRRYREERGWTQEDAASELGVSPSTWWWWEARGREFQMRHLRKLHDLSGLPFSYLRGE